MPLQGGAQIVRDLAAKGLLAQLGKRLVVHRRAGHSALDAFLYLVYFFASGGHLGGLRGFYEDYREWGTLMGALGGRATLMSSASLSRLLGVADGEELASALRWLLLDATGGLELLRDPAVTTRDARGGRWHVFDFDPSRVAYRRRALPVGDDLPPPQRRLEGLAAPGYAGRKRGEWISSDALLHHAGAGLCLDVTVRQGHGEPRAQFASAVSAVAATCEALGHPRERALIRADGEFGGVPSLTEAHSAGVAYLTRMVRYDLFSLEAVRDRLATARWDRVPDSGSGPVRYAADLGDVVLPAGDDTRQSDGSRFEPVLARVVVSRFHCEPDGGRHGSGMRVGDEILEGFAALRLSPDEWPASAVVEAYYGRVGQENRLGQFDREFHAETKWSNTPGGQLLALACALFVWNMRIVRGVRQAAPLPEPEQQSTRVTTPSPTLAPRWTLATTAPATPDPVPDTPGDEEADAALAAALAEADVGQKIAHRQGWSWEPDALTLVTPAGERLPLYCVERTQLRFMARKGGKQAGIAISEETAARIRAALPGRRRLARAPTPTLRLVTRARDDEANGPFATGWPAFQPAAARARDIAATNAVVLDVTLIVSTAPTSSHPLISPIARHARHRRLTYAERLARNAAPLGAALHVEARPRARGPTTWSVRSSVSSSSSG